MYVLRLTKVYCITSPLRPFSLSHSLLSVFSKCILNTLKKYTVQSMDKPLNNNVSSLPLMSVTCVIRNSLYGHVKFYDLIK